MADSLKKYKNTPEQIIPNVIAQIIFFAQKRPANMAAAAIGIVRGWTASKNPKKVAIPFPPLNFR